MFGKKFLIKPQMTKKLFDLKVVLLESVSKGHIKPKVDRHAVDRVAKVVTVHDDLLTQ